LTRKTRIFLVTCGLLATALLLRLGLQSAPPPSPPDSTLVTEESGRAVVAVIPSERELVVGLESANTDSLTTYDLTTLTPQRTPAQAGLYRAKSEADYVFTRPWHTADEAGLMKIPAGSIADRQTGEVD